MRDDPYIEVVVKLKRIFTPNDNHDVSLLLPDCQNVLSQAKRGYFFARNYMTLRCVLPARVE